MGMSDERRRQRLEALGVKWPSVKRNVPTPEGEPKMSAVILELVDPYLKRRGVTASVAEWLIGLTVAAWNKSLLPHGGQSQMERDLIDVFVAKDGYAESVGTVIEIMDVLADRQMQLYPNLRKLIVDYDLDISEGSLTLDVTSAPVPDPLVPPDPTSD